MDRRSRAYITCFWDFTQSNNGAFVAIETLFLVLFTVALWLVTRTAADAAMRSAITAEKALIDLEAPFVVIEIIEALKFVRTIDERQKETWTRGITPIKFIFANYGRTPAELI